MEPVFKLGKRGLPVAMELHKVNRSRLCHRLRELWSSDVAPTHTLNGVYVLLQGGSSVLHGGSDVEIVFRQVLICYFYHNVFPKPELFTVFSAFLRNLISTGRSEAWSQAGMVPLRLPQNELSYLCLRFQRQLQSIWEILHL